MHQKTNGGKFASKRGDNLDWAKGQNMEVYGQRVRVQIQKKLEDVTYACPMWPSQGTVKISMQRESSTMKGKSTFVSLDLQL